MATRRLNRMGLPEETVARMTQRGIVTCQDLLSRHVLDLVDVLDMPLATVRAVVASVASRISPTPKTVLQVQRERRRHAPSGIAALDVQLKGGLPVGTITEAVGASGVGKSTLCMQTVVLTAHAARERGDGTSVLYVDAERKFSVERLVAIAAARLPGVYGDDACVRELSARVHVVQPTTLKDFTACMERLEELCIEHQAALVVVDSMAAPVRHSFDHAHIHERQRMLQRSAAQLKRVAETFSVPMLVTNQVTSKRAGDAAVFTTSSPVPSQTSAASAASSPARYTTDTFLTAALGVTWSHAVNTRLVLEADTRGGRMLTLAKCPMSRVQRWRVRMDDSGLSVDGVVEGQDNFWNAVMDATTASSLT